MKIIETNNFKKSQLEGKVYTPEIEPEIYEIQSKLWKKRKDLGELPAGRQSRKKQQRRGLEKVDYEQMSDKEFINFIRKREQEMAPASL